MTFFNKVVCWKAANAAWLILLTSEVPQLLGIVASIWAISLGFLWHGVANAFWSGRWEIALDLPQVLSTKHLSELGSRVKLAHFECLQKHLNTHRILLVILHLVFWYHLLCFPLPRLSSDAVHVLHSCILYGCCCWHAYMLHSSGISPNIWYALPFKCSWKGQHIDSAHTDRMAGIIHRMEWAKCKWNAEMKSQVEPGSWDLNANEHALSMPLLSRLWWACLHLLMHSVSHPSWLPYVQRALFSHGWMQDNIEVVCGDTDAEAEADEDEDDASAQVLKWYTCLVFINGLACCQPDWVGSTPRMPSLCGSRCIRTTVADVSLHQTKHPDLHIL